MITTRRQWLLALFVALLLHAAVAVAIFWRTPDSGAENPGVGGLEVSMGAAGGAPGSVPPEAPEVAETAPQPPETSEVTEPATDARPEQATAAETAQPEEVLALNEPPSTTPDEPERADKPEPEVADAETPEPETAKKTPSEPEPQEADAEPTEAEPEEVVEAESVDASEPETAEETAPEPEPEPAEVERERVTATETGTQGEGGSQETQDRGRGESAAAGGAPGVDEDYKARLRAHLERHKEYPRRARMRRQEGVAVVRFVIDRSGNILDSEIVEASGHRALDDETRAMIERAEPLPPFPDDMSRERLELTIPVQFSLR